MPDPSNANNSFIPKRGPVTRRRTAASKQVYVFTLFSYVLVFAILLGTGATFLYSKYVQNRLGEEVAGLSATIQDFNESDMNRVQDFDLKLKQAAERFNNSASIVSVLEILEAATIGTVEIDSLSLEREADDKFLLSASMITDSLDSTIFQRGVYKLDKYEMEDNVSSMVITDFTRSATEDELGGENGAVVVSFNASIEVPLSNVLFENEDENDGESEVEIPVVEEVIPLDTSSTTATTTPQESQVPEDSDLEDSNQPTI